MKNKDHNKTFVNLTYFCNNNCISCIMNEEYKEKEVDIYLIKKKIDCILKNSNHIEFNGGEPTLNKNLFKILEYTYKKKPVEIGLITNSRLFSINSNVVKLKKVCPNIKVVTSLYGYNEKSHDFITRCPGSFKQQVKGIKNIIQNSIKLELRVIINKLNYKNLVEISKHISSNYDKNKIICVNFVNLKIKGISDKNKDLVSYNIKEPLTFLKDAIFNLSEKGFNVKISHFPLCVLEKSLRKYSLGISAEKSEVVFLKKCNKCFEIDRCPGIWAGYIKNYGGDDFFPILENEKKNK